MAEVNTLVPGIAVVDFTNEAWQGIAGAYMRTTYNDPDIVNLSTEKWEYKTSEDVLRDDRRLRDGYRWGSILTHDSKLIICDRFPDMLHFSIDINVDGQDLAASEHEQGITAQAIKREFQRQIGSHLGGLGILREMVFC